MDENSPLAKPPHRPIGTFMLFSRCTQVYATIRRVKEDLLYEILESVLISMLISYIINQLVV